MTVYLDLLFIPYTHAFSYVPLMSANVVPHNAQAATPPILFDPEGDVLTTDTLTTIIEEGRPMLNDYLRYAKVGGGQHGEVYLCQRLNPKAGHGDPDRRIPVVRIIPILGFAVGRLPPFFFVLGYEISEEE